MTGASDTLEEYWQNREFDIFAIVDGKVYMCEVKSSERKFQQEKFIECAMLFRPDTAVIAVMGKTTERIINVYNTVKEQLSKYEIETELMVYGDDATSKMNDD